MKVFIGDPCYVLSRDNYMSMLIRKNPDIMVDDQDIPGDTVVSNDCFIDGPRDEDEEVILPDDGYYTEYGSEYPGDEYKCVKVVNTWCGDGVFTDQDGNTYGVDSGQIGMVPECLWDENPRTDLGLVTECVNWDVFSRNGTIFCDSQTIFTGPGDEEGRVTDEDDEDCD